MTVETQTSRVSYTGAGSTGPFTIPFYFIADGDIVAIKRTIADGTETTLTLTTDYTLSGAGDEAGGTLTLVSALSSSYQLVIYRDPDILQEVRFPRNDKFPAATNERVLDLLTMIEQRLSDRADRSLHQPDGDTSAASALPNVIDRASKYLAFDASGNPIAADPTNGAVTSASAVQFLQSGSGATSRTVQEKLRDSVSVWDFLSAAELADVQAETMLVDVTSSFQKACNAAAGKTLYVPPGKYLIGTAGGIVLTSRTKISGAGLQASQIIRGFSPSSDDIGAINLNVRNGTILEDLFIQSKTGTSGGCLVSIVSTAATAASFHMLRNVDLTFETADTYKYALYVDGSAKTTGSIGARNCKLDNVIAFGGTDGAAYIKGAVEFSWSGYTAPGGSTSGDVVITGDATVNSFYVNLRMTYCAGLNIDRAQFVNFYGYCAGNLTNTSDVTDSNVFGMVDGTIQNNWVRSSVNGTGQYQFPATQNASSDANTLDDYEEGTWTPVLTFATPGDLNVAYSIQVGTYTKIGNVVTLTGSIRTSTFTHSSASGAARITGLPFGSHAVSSGDQIGSMMWQGITKANYTHAYLRLQESASLMTVRASGSGQSGSDVSTADMPTGGTVDFRFSITYRAAA